LSLPFVKGKMETVLVYGLVYSATLALIAVGFSLTFGVSRIANFSLGGIYVFAGYVPWLLMQKLGVAYPLAAVLSIILSAGLGWLIYWAMLWRVRGFLLAEVIGTFAIGIAILESIRGMGLVGFGAKLPKFAEGSVSVGELMIDYQRIFVVIVAVVVVAALWFFTHRTRMGRGFRAIAQNEMTALSFGVHSNRVAAFSMAAGSVLMAIAALTLLPLGLVRVDTGYEVLVIALTVGIVGGLESTAGIILASFLIGFIQILTAMYLGTHWVMVVYLVALVIMLAVRPSGLLGKSKELEERV